MTGEAQPLAEALVPRVFGKQRVLSAHCCNLRGARGSNTLAAVEMCVAAGVPRMEVDVRFLADDAMLVFHDPVLEGTTTGSGRANELTRVQAEEIRYLDDDSPLSFLEDVVDVVRGGTTCLQVDLKLMRPLRPSQAEALTDLLAPIRDQTLLGTISHWNLPPLAAAGFAVAFDPMLHIGYAPGREGDGIPKRLGIHGFWDDAPLAHIPLATAQEYLGSRINDIAGLAPAASEWMVDYPTILQMRALGVNLGERLGARGIELAAWTVPDLGADATAPLLRDLFDCGTTTVITNDGIALAGYAAALG